MNDDSPAAGDVPLGFTFGTEDDGWPVAFNADGHEGDVLALWLHDNHELVDLAEHLAAIDDVVAGRRPVYRAQCNDYVVLVEPAGYQVFWSLPGIPKTPHYRGPNAEIRRLIQRWSEHLDRIGWNGPP
jgi:hypothetical protein